MMKQLVPLASLAAIALTGCVSIGAKVQTPTALLTLTPDSISAAADAGHVTNAIDTLSVAAPLVPQALNATRIAVYDGNAQITYVKGATWAEMPANLFKALLTETIIAKTSRVIVDPRQSPLAVGSALSGRLVQFGIDAQSSKAVVTYDALLTHVGSKQVAAHRFQVMIPVKVIDGNSSGRAMNRAANEVAGQVSDWVAGN